MLDAIKTQMEAAFAREGVTAEVTFASRSMFSVFCECAAHYAKAKQILAQARQNLDSEDCDPEIGFFAYYSF